MSSDDPEADRAEELLRSFEQLALLYFASREERHRKRQGQAVIDMFAILHELDAMAPPRRRELARFFDHPAAEVQVLAATYLANIMPERAVPLLKKIDVECGASPPGMSAMRALFRYERGDLNV